MKMNMIINVEVKICNVFYLLRTSICKIISRPILTDAASSKTEYKYKVMEIFSLRCFAFSPSMHCNIICLQFSNA